MNTPFPTIKFVKNIMRPALPAVLLLAVTFVCASAQSISAPEYYVKAGFVYNFAKFVEWPQSAFDDSNTITLCIVTPTDAGDIFLGLNDKKVHGKKLVVKLCDDVDETQGCHIVFFASTDKNFIKNNLEAIKDQSILTVGETTDFIQLGGIINFFKEDDTLRFEVGLKAAEKAGLQVSSQLLMSADKVRK